MRFYAAIYTALFSQEERDVADKFVESVEVSNSIQFGTQLHGGFYSCTFTVRGNRNRSVSRFHVYLGAHVNVHDRFGHTMFEGFISETTIEDVGVTVQALGYYEKASKLYFDDIYPDETNVTVAQVLSDCINLMPDWNKSTVFTKGATYSFAKENVTFDKRKVNEVIEAVVKFGYTDADPRPIYFALWEQQLPTLILEKTYDSYPDWAVSVRNIRIPASGKAGLSQSLADTYNKVYAVYDDQGQGVSWTTPAEDAVSQMRYGIREGVTQNGGAVEGLAIAQDIRDAALTRYRYPRMVYTLEVTGVVRTGPGRLDYPYRIRAGQTILISDLDVAAASLVNDTSLQSDAIYTQSAIGFVIATDYDASSGTIRLDLGSGDTRFETLVGRLGLSGGLG